MKKKFSILLVSAVIVGLTLSLFGTALVFQAAPVKKQQGVNREVSKPIPAANIEVVKKVFLSEDKIEEIRGKGKPSSPPGQEKTKESGVATGVLGESLVEGANKYAVVIGICDYPGTDHDICWSDGDSINMYKVLIQLYGYKDENVYLYRDTTPNHLDITDGAATYDNILQAINTIRDNEVAGDEVVFFFSGHGGRIDDTSDDEADGKDEVILVHDGNEIVGILDDTLVSWFSDFETMRIAFVFDTCLAGGQNDVAETGRVVSMATGENQSAYVYSIGDSTTGELGEGVFSHYFVNEGMLQGLADGYNQLKITDTNVVVEEAFDYAKENIPPYLKRRQKPVISDYFTNDLLL